MALKPSDREKALDAFKSNRLRVVVFPSTRKWAKANGWRASFVDFETAFRKQALESPENFRLAVSKSNAYFWIVGDSNSTERPFQSIIQTLRSQIYFSRLTSTLFLSLMLATVMFLFLFAMTSPSIKAGWTGEIMNRLEFLAKTGNQTSVETLLRDVMVANDDYVYIAGVVVFSIFTGLYRSVQNHRNNLVREMLGFTKLDAIYNMSPSSDEMVVQQILEGMKTSASSGFRLFPSKKVENPAPGLLTTEFLTAITNAVIKGINSSSERKKSE